MGVGTEIAVQVGGRKKGDGVEKVEGEGSSNNLAYALSSLARLGTKALTDYYLT